MDWTGYTLGQRIKIACQMRQIDLKDAAIVVGVDLATFYGIAADRYTSLGPTLSKLSAISKGLGVRIGWLIEGEGEVWRPETTKPAEASSPLPVVPLLPLVPAKPLPQQRKRGG